MKVLSSEYAGLSTKIVVVYHGGKEYTVTLAPHGVHVAKPNFSTMRSDSKLAVKLVEFAKVAPIMEDSDA